MKHLLFRTMICIVILASTGILGRHTAQAAATARRPFPQHLVYAPGTIRPSHRTRAQQDADVRLVYNNWKADYLTAAGSGPGGARYRVTYGKVGTPERAVTVSEGQGYGMIIVATMAGYDANAQTYFDGMLRFARANPSDIDTRLMGWRIPNTDGNDSAFDGDADIAYALLLADQQWGSTGPINYRAEALVLINAVMESTVGPTSRLPLLGDWQDPNGTLYNQYAPRTSDLMTAHFRSFGRATGSRVWPLVVTASQQTITSLQQRYSPTTGLLPDFTERESATDRRPKPARPNYLEGPTDGMYYYNAGRDPWRIGTDALLNNDAVSLAQTRKITTWAKTATGGNPQRINAGYALDGTPIAGGDYFTSFFAAPLGVAAMTQPSQQQWLNAIYDSVRTAREGYFEDSVNLLCLLVMTGNYWDPTSSVSVSPAKLTFPAQALRTTSAPRTINLTNNGPTALTISQITLAGPNRADFARTSTCGTSLAVGASCAIRVTFTPSTAGARSARLVVTDTGVGSPHTVTLTGTTP